MCELPVKTDVITHFLDLFTILEREATVKTKHSSLLELLHLVTNRCVPDMPDMWSQSEQEDCTQDTNLLKCFRSENNGVLHIFSPILLNLSKV